MHDNWLFRVVYIGAAALAGAVTALAFRDWKKLSWLEIIVTLIVGFSFAIFVTPWLASPLFGIQPDDVSRVAGLTYALGSGSNVLLPSVIRWVMRVIGTENGGAE